MSGIAGGIGAGSRSGVVGRLITGPQIGSGTSNPGSYAGFPGPFLELKGTGPTLSLHDSGTGSPMWKIAGYNQDLRITDDGVDRLKVDSTGDIYSTAWTAWTPTVVGCSSTSVTVGEYHRLGKMIYVAGAVFGTSNAATFSITNLPYTVANNTNIYQSASIAYSTDNGNYVGELFAELVLNSTILRFLLNGNTSGWTSSGAKAVRFSGWYRAESI